MDTLKKRELALELLAKTDIWKSNYLPPFIKLLWKLGVDAPLPHFASFGWNAVMTGCPFGIFWGLSMWIFVWSTVDTPISGAILSALIAGGFFGLCMAYYYSYGKKKYNLPSWNDIGNQHT